MNKNKRPTLKSHEEEVILQFIIEKSKKKEPVLRQDIIDMVVKFIATDQRKNPFRNGVPGDKWFSLFRRRHNAKFLKLEPDMLIALESVGFSEKVLNTVQYFTNPGTPVSIRKDLTPTTNNKPLNSSKQTLVDESTTPEEASQPSSGEFAPGSRLQVMDFNEKWYPVKVVEVDYEEGEVLVHFEKWSDKYDEWVPMDSNRIRQPVMSHTPVAKKVFALDEKVLAVWSYNEKYPATIRKILPNDKYEVLFCDGYAKILRGCKIAKATEEDLKNMQLPPPKKPAPPMGADPIDPDLGPKEERRLKKRRMDVLESYLPHKKAKSESPKYPHSQTSPQPMSTYQPKEMPKVVLKGRGHHFVKRKPKMDDDDDDEDGYFDEDEDDYNDEDEEEEAEGYKDDYDVDDKEDDKKVEHESKLEMPTPKRDMSKTRRRRNKKVFDESKYIYRPRRNPYNDEESDRWNTEIPEGVSPVQIISNGDLRESVIIPDKKLPDGWTKHTLRRKKGAKWDVLLVNPEGKKFRSRNELRTYFAEKQMTFPEDKFDFMVGRKMEMIKCQTEGRNNISPLHKPTDSRDSSIDSKKTQPESTPDLKRVKTMLPKNRLTETPGDCKEGSPGVSAKPPPPFPLADKRNPDGGFTCCGKSFRKENLFQMHMKHYHPEYSNLFGSTPNVADLAYARTVGEPLEDSRAEAMTPKNSLIERVTKYEAERCRTTDTTNTVVETKPVVESPVDTTPVSTPEQPESSDVEDEQPAPSPAPLTPSTESEDSSDNTTKEEVEEDQPKGVKQEQELETDKNSKPMQDEKEVPDEEGILQNKNESKTSGVQPVVPKEEKEKQVDVMQVDVPKTPTEVKDETASSVPPLPVIKPLSKVTPGTSKSSVVSSEAVIVQTTTSAKIPVTITKYVPPGQKATAVSTKVSVTIPPGESKPTIKTLLPMRPPPAETKDVQELHKSKELKPKEEDLELPVKSKPRKRTVSESLGKKPKLVKLSTGSLEEELDRSAVVSQPSSTNNTSYRFSRNRTLPRVSLEKLNITPDSNDVEVSDGHTAQPSPQTEAVCENLRKEEIINCVCGYMEEDGLMIQCDLCLCWQHGMCNNIDKEADVPEKYVCYTCLHPMRQRASLAHSYNQDWLKEGRLPSLSFRPKDKATIEKRETMLKKCHDLTSALLQLQTVTYSLRVKTHIATKPDHPKLYLWAKSWKNDDSDVKKTNEDDSLKQVSGPQPEAAIDETECRLRLLEHVEEYQNQVDDRLIAIQAQLAGLESEESSDLSGDDYPRTKQTVQMVLNDLNTLRQVASLN